VIDTAAAAHPPSEMLYGNATLTAWRQLAETQEAALDNRLKVNRLAHYKPYNKQREFHAASYLNGILTRERLFMAGNQLGKTLAGAAEVAMHLTGRYPIWWTGRRYDRPVVVLAGSESAELTRDGVQRLLVGPPASEEDWGTGFIPKDCIAGTTRRQGTPNALDSVKVKHANGGYSYVNFKSYDQGRGKWQATTVDLVWFDEEPPADVYSEGLTRTNATRGMVFLTFTPLLGMSEVVRRYLQTPTNRRVVITMTIYDAEHYTPEERQNIIDDYPEHERDARASGIPILGSGRIFPLADSAIMVPPFPIPNHFKRLGGMDFGYDHPFGAVEVCYDADHDTMYFTREYRIAKKTPDQHAMVLRLWGKHLSWAWPHDGYREDRGGKDGAEELRLQYKRHGLKMLDEHATFSSGGFSTEAGVQEMLMRMTTGRLKVFDGMCPQWMEEFRLYHRQDGKIVKEMDDLMSASRIATMMLRKARIVEPDHNPWGFDEKPQAKVAQGVGEADF
jgi:phage terminase large subunit-like protein